MRERRTYVRVLSELQLRYAVVEGEKAEKTSTRDVSGGGLRLVMNEKPRKGDIVAIEVDVPARSRAVSAKAEIVWVSKVENDLWEAGINFTEIAAGDRATILRHVYSSARARRA